MTTVVPCSLDLFYTATLSHMMLLSIIFQVLNLDG